MNPAICADVASPARISAMAAAACSDVTSRPAVNGPRTLGQPPSCSSPGSGVAPVTAARDGVRALRGSAALTDDAAAFLFGASTPHPVSLARPQRMLEAGLAHGATEADGLGHVCLFVRNGIEDLGIEATTGGLVAPQEVHRGQITPSKYIEVLVRRRGQEPPGTEKKA